MLPGAHRRHDGILHNSCFVPVSPVGGKKVWFDAGGGKVLVLYYCFQLPSTLLDREEAVGWIHLTGLVCHALHAVMQNVLGFLVFFYAVPSFKQNIL